MAPHHTQQLRDAIDHTLKTKNHATAQARARIKTHLTSLNNQITECANLIGHPQWPTDVLTKKVTQLQTQRDLTQHQLDSLSTTHLAHAADTIHTLTDLLQQPYQLYNQLNATQRQHLNHLLFQRLYIDTHDTDPDRTPHIGHDVSDTLAPLHHHLHHTTHNTKNPAPKNSEQGSINTKMVDLLAAYYNTKHQVDEAITAINLPAHARCSSIEPALRSNCTSTINASAAAAEPGQSRVQRPGLNNHGCTATS